MRKFFVLSMVMVLAVVVFAACGSDPAADAPEGVPQIEMMYWGGLDEQEAMTRVIDNFNALNEGRIYVINSHIPADFGTVMNTRLAAGTPPDIAYTGSAGFYTMASEGHYFAIDNLISPGFLDTVVHDAIWRYDGRVYGLSTAQVNLILYYNADLFYELGVERPPSRFEDALSWDEFVNLAQRVTTDRNGNNALSPDFNPRQIATFGFNFWVGLNDVSLFAYSNGARLVNEDLTNTDLDSPEWIDTMYKLNRLIHHYRVVPTPADNEGLPSYPLESGAFAMTVGGRWSMLGFARQHIPFELGVAVMPDLGHGPFTMSPPGVTSIMALTQHPELAWEFWEYKMDVENGATELYAGGLWQPIVHDPWYTDPAALAVWTDNAAHPPAFAEAVLDMAMRPSQIVPLSSSYIRRVGEVTTFVTPALENIMGNPMTFDEVGNVMRNLQAEITANDAFHGVYNHARLLPRR